MMNDPGQESDSRLSFQGGRLMGEMDKVVPDVVPMSFHQALIQSNPMFGEKDDHGHPKQQDADECYQCMLQAWR